MLYMGSTLFFIYDKIVSVVSVSIIKVCLEIIYIKLIHTKYYIG